jgi:hypothetical protein
MIVDAEEADVDAFADKEVPHEVAVRIASDAGDDGRPKAEARESRTDVAGEAADVARLRPHLAQRGAELVRVEVDPHAAEDCDVDHRAILPRLNGARARDSPRTWLRGGVDMSKCRVQTCPSHFRHAFVALAHTKGSDPQRR